MTCGIYKITEIETGRCYIGQSRNVQRRWKHHHKRFSPDLFNYEIIMECDTEQLDFWEIAWITSERSAEFGFNQTAGGQRWNMVYSEETRQKMSENATGRTLSEETRRKMSEARKGRKHSEEHRRKMSESLMGRAGGKGMMGKRHSEESRQKMSEAAKGRTLSEEHRHKISDAFRAKREN